MTTRRRNVGQTKKGEASTASKPKEQLGHQVALETFHSKVEEKIVKKSYLYNIGAFLLMLIFGYILVDYLSDVYDDSMVSHDVEVSRLFVEVPCSADYGKKFKNCSPKKCGRCVMDHVFDTEIVQKLREIAERGLAHGGSNGGASILDLHSGALSKGDKFIDVYKLEKKVFNEEDFEIYRSMKNTIKKKIATEFEIPEEELYLTNPTFFSRMDSKPAKTKHDEYWHPHIDKITYKTFYYTSLLYLSDYGTDFMGGRFSYIDKRSNKTVEPKAGRLSFFTSGSENPHFVEKVTSGTRYAITVSFTCDKKAAIKDPG